MIEGKTDVHSENSDLHSGTNLGAVHGTEDSKASAHQRSSVGGVHLLRDREGEVFVRTNVAGVASLGNRTVGVRRGVGVYHS